MARNLWLRGDLSEIRGIVEEYLESLGKKAKPKHVGRLYIYRVGLTSKIVLAPYSDGTIYVKIPKKHEALIEKLSSYTYRGPPRARDSLDTILDLIVERQILLNKVRRSRHGLILSSSLAVSGLALAFSGFHSLGALIILIGMASAFIPIGLRGFWALTASTAVVPALYLRYKRRLEEVTAEIKALAIGLSAKDREKLEKLYAYPRD